ncbi:MAG: YafY family transcriptional regulator [Granulosicoccus sp.]|nr:YafY family transcriptional regulator [Granulosicoccus sp.]
MRKTDRMFEIIQILRSHSRTVTAEELAEQLEVSVRTIYRDIQALQAMRTPIEGEAGVGYLMRNGYDLPPINFSANELEAIVVGLNLLARTGDRSLQRAAKSVANKIESVRGRMDSLVVSEWGVEMPNEVDIEQLRAAIRSEQKLRIVYQDGSGKDSRRRILPIAMVYYIEVVVLAAWCELRNDFRHFRVDRIIQCEPVNQYFRTRGHRLRQQWHTLQAQTSPSI